MRVRTLVETVKNRCYLKSLQKKKRMTQRTPEKTNVVEPASSKVSDIDYTQRKQLLKPTKQQTLKTNKTNTKPTKACSASNKVIRTASVNVFLLSFGSRCLEVFLEIGIPKREGKIFEKYL